MENILRNGERCIAKLKAGPNTIELLWMDWTLLTRSRAGFAQAQVVIPNTMDWRGLNLRAEVEVKGMLCPVRASHQKLNDDGSLTLRPNLSQRVKFAIARDASRNGAELPRTRGVSFLAKG